MVKDISGQLKSVFKTLNWQESQKRALVQHREEVLQKMEKHNARLDENLAGVEEELQVRKAYSEEDGGSRNSPEGRVEQAHQGERRRWEGG